MFLTYILVSEYTRNRQWFIHIIPMKSNNRWHDVKWGTALVYGLPIRMYTFVICFTTAFDGSSAGSLPWKSLNFLNLETMLASISKLLHTCVQRENLFGFYRLLYTINYWLFTWWWMARVGRVQSIIRRWYCSAAFLTNCILGNRCSTSIFFFSLSRVIDTQRRRRQHFLFFSPE